MMRNSVIVTFPTREGRDRFHEAAARTFLSPKTLERGETPPSGASVITVIPSSWSPAEWADLLNGVKPRMVIEGSTPDAVHLMRAISIGGGLAASTGDSFTGFVRADAPSSTPAEESKPQEEAKPDVDQQSGAEAVGSASGPALPTPDVATGGDGGSGIRMEPASGESEGSSGPAPADADDGKKPRSEESLQPTG